VLSICNAGQPVRKVKRTRESWSDHEFPTPVYVPPFVSGLHRSKTFGELEGFVELRRNNHPTVGVHVAVLAVHGDQKRQTEVHLPSPEGSGSGQENHNGECSNFALHGIHPVLLDTAARLFGQTGTSCMRGRSLHVALP